MIEFNTQSQEFELTTLTCVDALHFPIGIICMRPKENISAVVAHHLDGIALSVPSLVVDQFPVKACPDGSLVQSFHRYRWGDHKNLRGESDDVDDPCLPGVTPIPLPFQSCHSLLATL